MSLREHLRLTTIRDTLLVGFTALVFCLVVAGTIGWIAVRAGAGADSYPPDGSGDNQAEYKGSEADQQSISDGGQPKMFPQAHCAVTGSMSPSCTRVTRKFVPTGSVPENHIGPESPPNAFARESDLK